ncbi:unnamed protein product [Rhizoctonia solani]|uniref:Glucose N-acetyltransferase 1 n=1 Tax=Rhizoctonia solani TaxID=456999 RepID=A0A8H3HPF5_9AGAM|nr:unnamed protein product [Rhizoctonia solani]
MDYYSAHFFGETQRKKLRNPFLILILGGASALLLVSWSIWHYVITHSSSLNDQGVHSSLQFGMSSNITNPLPASVSDQCKPTVAPVFGHNATNTSYWPFPHLGGGTPTKFAYVLYATEKEYLCNCLINFRQLRQLNVAAELALIFPAPWIDKYPSGSVNPIRRMLDKAQNEYRVNLHPLELWSTGRGDHTWANSLTKLHIFGLTSYTRIVYLDSDGIVLNNLDHLFLAPQARIALPRAYWLEEGVLASHIMVITPSDTLMNRVRDTVKATNGFDMEAINKISASSAMILPHRRYALLTGEFRKADHSRYLSDEGPGAEWDPQAELSSAFFVHFSDWPLPKPWIKAGTDLIESTQPACDPKEKVECWNRKHWHGIYNLYNQLKDEVCVE